MAAKSKPLVSCDGKFIVELDSVDEEFDVYFRRRSSIASSSSDGQEDRDDFEDACRDLGVDDGVEGDAESEVVDEEVRRDGDGDLQRERRCVDDEKGERLEDPLEKLERLVDAGVEEEIVRGVERPEDGLMEDGTLSQVEHCIVEEGSVKSDILHIYNYGSVVFRMDSFFLALSFLVFRC